MSNVVITGANSGFGLLTARKFAQAGHTVHLNVEKQQVRRIRAQCLQRRGAVAELPDERQGRRSRAIFPQGAPTGGLIVDDDDPHAGSSLRGGRPRASLPASRSAGSEITARQLSLLTAPELNVALSPN